MTPELTRLLERQAKLLAELAEVQRQISSHVAEVSVSTCEVCGTIFTSTRRDAAYCSGACRQKAYRDRQKEEK